MLKVTNKTSRRSGVFIVYFEHISHIFLMFLLLTLNNISCLPIDPFYAKQSEAIRKW